jgi:hypothetical protein
VIDADTMSGQGASIPIEVDLTKVDTATVKYAQ